MRSLTGHSYIREMGSFNRPYMIKSCAFFPDGKRIVSGSCDKTLSIWNVDKEREIMTFCLEGQCLSCSVSPDGSRIVCGDDRGNFYIFKLVGIEIGIPVITAVRLWLNDSIIHKGKWDKDIICVCPYCGARFPCPILNNSTFDDPGLLSECPECGKKLKLNPFVVDNKGKWD